MTSPADIRARAARVVTQVAVGGQSLDATLKDGGGTMQERGLLRSLCFGTVRWYIRVEAVLDRLLARPSTALQADVRSLALVGLYQLLHTDIARHAAVAETVNATRVLGVPRAASLINALLRRCLREHEALTAAVDADPALRTAHPHWLAARIEADWPGLGAVILDADNRHPPFWLRVNRQRISVTDYVARLRAAGLVATTSEFAPDAVLLEHAVDVRSLPGFDDGWVSVQDAAAQMAARLVQPEAGDRILDACTAPGSKACHLLELEPRIAELVAIDNDADRLARVRQNLERLQLRAIVQQADAAEPAAWWDGRPFDRILLDVPCSATGVIRRHPDIKLLRREPDIAALAKRQAGMLEALWPLLRPGGRLVYASCSVLRAENAAVVQPFLDRHPDAADVTAAVAGPWPTPVRGTAVRDPGLGIRTGEAGMDGFHYACLHKMHG